MDCRPCLHAPEFFFRVEDFLYFFNIVYVPRQVDDDKGRNYELEQSAVKCMRGILFCYMRQAAKVKGNKQCTLDYVLFSQS